MGSAGAAVLVLLGLFGGGGGGWYLYDQSRGPLPPPDGPWPEQFGFTVSLCDKGSGGCAQAGNEAVKNPARIEAALGAIPGVATLRPIRYRAAGAGHHRPPLGDRRCGEDLLTVITGQHNISTGADNDGE